MSKTAANRDIVERRREVVSQLRLMGLTVREITTKLLEEGIVNPDSGEPYGKTTIGRDLKFMREKWRERADAAISEHQAKQYAQLELIQRRAFAQRDYDLALKTHDRIAKLLGTNAPDRQEMTATVDAELLAAAERRLTILHAKIKEKQPNALPES